MNILCAHLIAVLLASPSPPPSAPETGQRPAASRDRESPVKAKRKVTAREIRALVERLSHPEFREREEATRELASIGAAALPHLGPLLADRTSEAGWRARRIFLAVRGYPPEVEGRLEAIVGEVAAGPVRDAGALAEEIIGFGDAAVERAAEALASGGIHARAFRARLLAQTAVRAAAGPSAPGGDRSDALLRRAGALGIAALREAALDARRPPETRLFALFGIAGTAPGQATDVACRLLADGQLPVRRCAGTLLEEFAEARHWEAIARGAAAIPGPWRQEARELVRTVAGRMGREKLQAMLRHEDAAVRMVTAWALGLGGEAEAIPVLRKALEDRDPRVRGEAAGAIARFARGEDLPVLARRLEREGDAGVRRRIAEGIARWEGEAAACWLAICLRDPSPWVRRRAARLLARRKDKALLAALAATARDPDPIAAREAIAAVRAMAGRNAPAPPETDDADALREAAAKLDAWWKKAAAHLVGDARAPAAQSAEAGRVLGELGGLVIGNFYSVGREEKLDPQALLGPARKAMAAAAARAPQKARPFLLALLRRGRFYDLHDLGRFPATLPIPWKGEEWVPILNAGARGLVAGIGDPFTRLLISHDPEGRLSKEIIPILFGGAKSNGLIVRCRRDRVEVDFVLYDAPAYWAGLRFGDRIVLVDGKPPAGMDEDALNRRLNGEKVEIAVFREGWLRPARIALEPIPVFEGEPARGEVLPGGIGYLRLQYFGLDAAARFEWALRRLEAEKIRCLVVDLRNNPGGLVNAAVEIADKFLPGGKRITTLRSREEEEKAFESTDSETDRTYPVAVLVNRSSASAAEMLCGAWRDHDRVVLVGERTYGKGVGQQGFAVSGLPGPSVLGPAAPLYLLTLTTVRYTLPSGKSPHGAGISPAIRVPLPAPSGEREARIRAIARTGGFAAYLDRLLAEHGAEARRLARFDGGDPSRWPGLEAFAKGLSRPCPLEDVRAAVRRAVRARLAREDPKAAVLVDLDDDPALRAAVREVAERAKIDISKIPEYGGRPEGEPAKGEKPEPPPPPHTL